jgi:hypothetical protein
MIFMISLVVIKFSVELFLQTVLASAIKSSVVLSFTIVIFPGIILLLEAEPSWQL